MTMLLSLRLIILYPNSAKPYINEETMIKYLFLCLSFTKPSIYPTMEKPNNHNILFNPKEQTKIKLAINNTNGLNIDLKGLAKENTKKQNATKYTLVALKVGKELIGS